MRNFPRIILMQGLAKNRLQLPSLIQSTKDGAVGEVKGSCLAEERGNKMG